MRRAALLVAILLAGAAHGREPRPVPPQSRWSTLPRLAMKPEFKADESWVRKAMELQDEGKCSFQRKDESWTKLEVPFVLLVSPKGKVEQVEVAPTACPPLEKYIAGIVRDFGKKDVVAPASDSAEWFGSKFVAGWQN